MSDIDKQKHDRKKISKALIKKILDDSQSKIFECALLEWRVVSYRKKKHIEGHLHEHCDLCGKEELLHLFTIKNIKTGKYVSIVGSHCIFRHFVLPEQVKKIMRFLETNSLRRKMLYGKYESKNISDVLKIDPDYILDEVDNQTEFNKYIQSEVNISNSKNKKLRMLLQCMEIVYNIHVRCQTILIDNSHFDDYLGSDEYHNKYTDNYTKNSNRITMDDILNIKCIS
jgi:hypothetical protein